jgi:hypothetical protein
MVRGRPNSGAHRERQNRSLSSCAQDGVHFGKLNLAAITQRKPDHPEQTDQKRYVAGFEFVDAYIPDLTLICIEGGTHWLMDECPERLNGFIIAFLAHSNEAGMSADEAQPA